MKYLEVVPASQKFHKHDALTYAADAEYPVGTLVSIQLLRTQVVGIVVGASHRPSFAVKPIERVLCTTPLPSTCLKLLEWFRSYYPYGYGVTAGLFVPQGLLQTPRASKDEQPAAPQNLPILPALTIEQTEALRLIRSAAIGSTTLLHGDTGSGKTRLYMELALEQLQSGRDVLVLTPEISLTPQLVREFETTLADKVTVFHSGLTTTERRKAWLQILTATTPQVVIGPRSALFLPYRHLGIVIVDEAHESAYKQEQAPYYDARRVASKLAALHGARAVLGTATPAVDDYYIATAKGLRIARLSKLALSGQKQSATIRVVDAREKNLFSRHGSLSDPMIDSIRECLHAGEQSLLFLNRRGTARVVMCQDCGWQASCPRCDLPLTYHGDRHEMRCHTCGYSGQTPSVCPVDGSAEILFRSSGTKSIVEAIQRLFPSARIMRFDTDNAKQDRFEQHYAAVSRGDVDILIGTQTLAKGLDLPLLGFVGIISADTALGFPDYTATERTYQLVSQVIGRVGRGHRKGSIVLQTYQPDSPAIQAAVQRDWDNFYQSEIAERRQFRFPPFCYVLKITVGRKTEKGAEKAARDLAKLLLAARLPVEIIGPSPCFYERVANTYRWQIVIKAALRQRLLDIVPLLPATCVYDLDPSNLL